MRLQKKFNMINKKLVDTEVQNFIEDYQNKKIDRLIFIKSPINGLKMSEIVEQIESKKKIKSKLPTWYNRKNIIYPNKIFLEQSSSEKTALYKSKIVKGNTLIDLTGGFGVDSYFFSKKIEKIIHCEINNKLSNISKFNFNILNASNIENIKIDGLDYIENTSINFDWIYVDPSRRDCHNNKKILLKDCKPNIIECIDNLIKRSKNILIKLSPMLDIKNTLKHLKNTKEVHIVSLKGEVKELLFVVERNYKNDIMIKNINLDSGQKKYNFNYNDEKNKKNKLGKPLKYLYEPNSSVLKSGGFSSIAIDFKLEKLDDNTHLYTSHFIEKDFPGKIYFIDKIIPFKKTLLNKLIKGQKINIKRRNFPKKIEEIKNEYKIKDGGDNYMFLTTNISKPIILICSKIIMS